MKRYFEAGYFSKYIADDLHKARGPISPPDIYASHKITVFISHKHDDLDDLKGFIGFLEKQYDVRCYIDSKDPTMPKVTSSETADNIKHRIKSCDKFILLATNGAIESKWCNWELGYGDAIKYSDGKIALFPMKPKGSDDSEYKGSEYMSLYPSIAYYDGSEKYRDGKPIECGYYVRKHKENAIYLTPLRTWLQF